MGEINPIDIFFSVMQGIVALLLLLRVDGLPDFLVYLLAGSLILSGIYTLLV